MRTSRTACPSCGADARSRGTIPPNHTFAGRPFVGAERRLYSCRTCQLRFSHPRPTQAQLAELYAGGANDTWTVGEVDRADWRLAADWLSGLGDGTSVLDIGCFEGEFLASLPDGIERFGVEVHGAAAQRAAQLRDVEVIGAEYDDLRDETRQFDVITSFDVIEHVRDPRHMLRVLGSLLKPGGRIILGTGNADSPMWRFMGARYWYSWYPEHISYIGPRWCAAAASDTGLTIGQVELLSRSFGSSTIGRETLNNVAYRVLPYRASQALRRVAGRGGTHHSGNPPIWVAGKDHFLVSLEKK